jgi:NAD(P)-dependent dehydrogenase (short-subunit alcohol dehydrogenase family)
MAGFNAIITGASRGLGRSIALEFWAKGANVALVARSRTDLETLRASLSPVAGQEAVVVEADLSDPAAPEAVVRQLRGKWEHVDALVNNAAIQGPIGPLWENEWAAWQRTIQVDLLAPVALCRACIPWMRPGGAIVNLSGGGATAPRPKFTAYATAKAGLVRFTETLAHETAEQGIRVNAIAPGAMNTAILEDVLRAGEANAGKEYEAAVRQKCSGGQPPEKAAALACYLASPESAPLTGRLIAAIWDPWRGLAARGEELQGSDIYTLRRITPEDRGKQWI